MAERNPKKDKINIFIVSIDEPLYVPIFFQDIIGKFSDEICGITVLSLSNSKKVSKGISDTLSSLIRARLDYYGPVDFTKYLCLIICYKIKGILAFLNKKNSRPYSLRALAKSHNIKTVPCPKNDLNDESYIRLLNGFDIDLMICLVPQILKESFLKIPKIGCLNTHCSLLPKYRGREPLFWAMLNQDKKAGVTIHLMDKDIDSGPIVRQGSIDVNPRDTLNSLYRRATELAGKLMTNVVTDIENHNLKFIRTETDNSSYCPWPSKEDVLRFRRLGKRFI